MPTCACLFVFVLTIILACFCMDLVYTLERGPWAGFLRGLIFAGVIVAWEVTKP